MIPVLILLLLQSAMVFGSSTCNRSCGDGLKQLPFPFGFSSGCEILLNCTSNGTMSIGEFPVYQLTPDTIMINIPAKCGRRIEAMKPLFGKNFAPTSNNGILLQNCSSPELKCMIPSTMIQTQFELQDCGKDNISCFSEPHMTGGFIGYENLTGTGCKSLFSAISSPAAAANTTAVSLDIQVIELGWWLQGHCRCSKNADCNTMRTPGDGKPGFRCQCSEGFTGDGYQGGSGCRRDDTRCNPAKYLLGECGGKTRIGVLIGGVIAGAALMVSVGLICCIIRRRLAMKNWNRRRRELRETTGITIPVYSYKDIEKATNNFSDKRRLGDGAYGTVYSGKLHDNDEWVAIKRIRHRDTDSIEQVTNEIKLLSSVNHPNLVRLLGCSIEKGEQILVYEFMPNGTLSQHLQREKGSGLPWPVRLGIVSETSQAIAYLHNAMHPPIYHRDVKSSNILLDYNYKSKVADFGLSRFGLIESSHISTAPQGTPGYLDPQYHQDFHLSDKSDVYSFGVVLVEIITGLKAVDFTRPQNEVNLAALAVDKIGKGGLLEIIDPLIEAEKDVWTLSSVNKVAEIAFRCLAFHRDMRPSMMEVAIELEQMRLSKWGISEDSIITASSSSSSRSSSDASEKPLSFSTMKPSEKVTESSPVSVQDPWLSEQSSPSSNSFINQAMQRFKRSISLPV
ncbi:PREDICTED: wall-associated receptor kinase-like 14 [Ipomoea nil]|uniref:wall-associated receptor kinase-like 14 n=1 Tax=Ipomoea nil TaxID=35883 RepID=UPI000900F1CA|nr:PREDICTED: wall-associated receptor kinase-like 14 [Ipomoea nil]